ncbi:MAG: hypothetical protein JXJ04_22110, partial [Spirochaetales bacterium]|nr:hypothetical protein [Spirochaetales bacterium]
MKIRLLKKKPETIDTLTKEQRIKLDELLYKEEKNGEKRVNRITLITSIVFLIIIFSIIGLVGYSPNSTANLISLFIFFVYNVVMFILLKKNIYLPVFKYITVFINVTTIIMCLYLYSYFTGWVHALRTISLLIMFIIISLSGFYQRPRVPVFAAVLVSIEYALLFFYALFFTDIPMSQMETFEIPAISIDLVIVYCCMFLIVGFIVSYITRRLQILLERSLHFEAEAILKKEIEEAHKKLKEMDHYKTVFFQNITHEFRTPLTLILGPLDSILSTQRGTISEKVKEELIIIRRNAKRLLLLVNQL